MDDQKRKEEIEKLKVAFDTMSRAYGNLNTRVEYLEGVIKNLKIRGKL